MSTQISESIPKYDVSYEDWLANAPESRMSEWVKGKVIDFVPPTQRHQDVLVWFSTLLYLLINRRELGVVIPAPFEMKLTAIPSSREPDVLVVLNEHLDRLDGKRLNGPADLAIEIVSPDSVSRDKRDKFAEYATVGVSEYWIIDPRLGRYSFQALRLTDDHVFEPIPTDHDGRIPSSVIADLRIDPNWIEQDPLPDPLDIFLALVPDGLSRR